MKLLKYLEHINYEKTAESIHYICDELRITNYTINNDLSIDVNSNVSLYRGLSNNKLTELPLTFNKVSGTFNCSGNKLTNLKGSPREVGDTFLCSFNQLTTLKDGPIKIGNALQCGDNLLTKLDIPVNELKVLVCPNNKIDSLEGMPLVRNSLTIKNNNLTSLEHLNCEGEVHCTDNSIYMFSINDRMPITYSGNPIFRLIIFIKLSSPKLNSLDDFEIIERLDEFDVIDGRNLDILNLNKLFDFYNVLFNEEEFVKNLKAYTTDYEIH